jgi:hypothetical protein
MLTNSRAHDRAPRRRTRGMRRTAPFGWLAFAVGLTACAGRTADSAAPDARTPDAPVDAGPADALPAPEVDANAADALEAHAPDADTEPADSPVEATSGDATDADGDAAPPECTPGETLPCYNFIVACEWGSRVCGNDGRWRECPCVQCDFQLGAGTCSWIEEMADSSSVPRYSGSLGVYRIGEDGGRSLIQQVYGSSCPTDGGWQSEVSGDGGTRMLTVSLCPASCDEHQANGVQFVLTTYCVQT